MRESKNRRCRAHLCSYMGIYLWASWFTNTFNFNLDWMPPIYFDGFFKCDTTFCCIQMAFAFPVLRSRISDKIVLSSRSSRWRKNVKSPKQVENAKRWGKLIKCIWQNLVNLLSTNELHRKNVQYARSSTLLDGITYFPSARALRACMHSVRVCAFGTLKIQMNAKWVHRTIFMSFCQWPWVSHYKQIHIARIYLPTCASA